MSIGRKVTPKVKDGKVQRKNRADVSPSMWNSRSEDAFIAVERPGRGYQHVLRQRDVASFLDLLPERDVIVGQLKRDPARTWRSYG